MTQKSRTFLSLEAALEQGRKLPYAMISAPESVYLGPAAKWPGFSQDGLSGLPEGLEEARFYDDRREIRIFRGERGLQAVCLQGEECIYETYRLDPGFVRRMTELWGLMPEEVGDSLTVARDIAFDEDGQAFVETTRLAAGKGAADLD